MCDVETNHLNKINELDSQLQYSKHYNEGYRESMLTLIHGCDKVWDILKIDVDRYPPDSARRITYDIGWESAKFDYNI